MNMLIHLTSDTIINGSSRCKNNCKQKAKQVVVVNIFNVHKRTAADAQLSNYLPPPHPHQQLLLPPLLPPSPQLSALPLDQDLGLLTRPGQDPE